MNNKKIFLGLFFVLVPYALCKDEQTKSHQLMTNGEQCYILTDAEKSTLAVQVKQSLKNQKELRQFLYPMLKDFLIKNYNAKFEKINELSLDEYNELKNELSNALDLFIKEHEDSFAGKIVEIYEIIDPIEKSCFIYSFKKSLPDTIKEQVIESLDLQREVYQAVQQKKNHEN